MLRFERAGRTIKITHFTAALLMATVAAHPGGYFWCANSVASVTTGVTSPHETSFRLNPPYALRLMDVGFQLPVGAWTAGATYGFSIVATTAASPVGGFILCGFNGTQLDVGIDFIGSTRVGTFNGDDIQSQAMADDGVGHDCSMCVTHTNSVLKPSVNMTWTAPTAGTGLVTFYAIVVQDYPLQPSRVYLTVSELGGTPVPTATGSRTPTPSLTSSKTSTSSRSPASASTSPAATTSATPSVSDSLSASSTLSAAASISPVASSSRTMPASRSASRTRIPSHSATRPATRTRTGSRSKSMPRTASRTKSHTPSRTRSHKAK